MFVATESLCRFVSNQVQYNIESAQYLGESNYIIMIDKCILDIYYQSLHIWMCKSRTTSTNLHTAAM